jgi:hypothetical protein
MLASGTRTIVLLSSLKPHDLRSSEEVDVNKLSVKVSPCNSVRQELLTVHNIDPQLLEF